jgi:hypothetical protein
VTTYTAAFDASRIGKQLIDEVHTHLVDVRVEFVFRDKAAKSHGRTVLGRARKVTGLNAFMAREITSDVETMPGEEFFLIELSEEDWNEMGPAQRRALVDHELTHCVAEVEGGELKLWIRGHDLEEFAEVVDRNGLWEDNLKTFAESIKEQLGFFGPEPEPVEEPEPDEPFGHLPEGHE